MNSVLQGVVQFHTGGEAVSADKPASSLEQTQFESGADG